jgi:hypothetical protein
MTRVLRTRDSLTTPTTNAPWRTLRLSKVRQFTIAAPQLAHSVHVRRTMMVQVQRQGWIL